MRVQLRCMKRLIPVTCFLLVLLFTYTALTKLADYAAFSDTLARSPLLAPVAPIVGVVLPLGELFIAALLVIERTRTAGLWWSLALLSGMTVYLMYMVLFAPDLPCSCGGVLQAMSWRQHIGFNLFFVAITLIALLINYKKATMNRSPPVYSSNHKHFFF
jgi:hypothetical protein